MSDGSFLIPNQDRSETMLFEERYAGLLKRIAVHLLELQEIVRRYDVSVEAPFFERTSDLVERIPLHRKAENAPPFIRGPADWACDDLDFRWIKAMLAAETLRDDETAVSLGIGKFREGQDRRHDVRSFEGDANEGRCKSSRGQQGGQYAVDRVGQCGCARRVESGGSLGSLTTAPAGAMPHAVDLTGADTNEAG
jgi:hypothetical protein